MRLESKGIVNGIILKQYGKRSEHICEEIPQISLPVAWSELPGDTQSLAVTFLDYDNIADEGMLWIHWLIANLPPEKRMLEENASIDLQKEPGEIVQGTNSWAVHGTNDASLCTRYGGPTPVGFPHNYEIKLYALSEMLPLGAGFTLDELYRSMEGRILDEAVLFGRYSNE